MILKNKIITGISYLNTSWKRKLISISKTLSGKYGIEIGGPSPTVFGLKSVFPVYIYASKIDGVNFSDNTIWEGKITDDHRYKYFQKNTGYQFIKEAVDLSEIPSEHYDFVLSSHNLEHVSNPIKALFEWSRVLKKNGTLVLVLPDKMKTFDYKRPYTIFQHILHDYKNNVDERDDTHFKEIMDLHDFSYEAYSNPALLKERLQNNISYRVAHHHVFNFETIKEMLSYTGFTVIYQQACIPFNLVTIAVKNN